MAWHWMPNVQSILRSDLTVAAEEFLKKLDDARMEVEDIQTLGRVRKTPTKQTEQRSERYKDI
jgi:hypothetical protein